MVRLNDMFSLWGSGFISEHGKDALKTYKYRGQDKSLLYKHILSPWAEYCVQRFTPMWMAPNSITLFGLCFQALAFAVAFYYSPDMRNAPPWWTYVLTGLCMFIYSTADNMDGKQARRTGSSSPLGLLFDHGCDAINAGLLGWASVAIHVQAGGSWRAFCLWAITCTPFFYNTWEEFHTNELVLPVVNGPNEGVMGMVGLLFLTAFFGPEGLWAAPHTNIPVLRWALTPVVDSMRFLAGEQLSLGPGASASPSTYLDTWYGAMTLSLSAIGAEAVPGTGPHVTNLELLLAGTALAAFFTVTWQVVNVLRLSWAKGGVQEMGQAMARQLPFLSLLFIVSAWLHDMHCRKVVYDHWALFYGCAGALFVDLTVRLMVAHVCDQEYQADVIGLVLFALAPLMFKLDLMPVGPDKSSVAALCLLASLTVAWLKACYYILHATSEVKGALDIDVFDIRKQTARRVVGGAPTSALEAGAMALAEPKLPDAAPTAREILTAAASTTTSTGAHKRAGSAARGKAARAAGASVAAGSGDAALDLGRPGAAGSSASAESKVVIHTKGGASGAASAGSRAASTTSRSRAGSVGPARRR